ncbi:LPS export ABC transporter periplasmic protein LptC [Leptospira perolatii]|uniref:LPS export ABC transporter periplasmic protein LptC n=1 Tax=Leptospira perolatii TaxID=2023191 RepID=A0A2M9ZJB5_9LEPT|nr:LPS export ABC transporter periplasmic protein LptC [Leptospira perolatii]PJZ69528.1 LPS export ABC transporter periplasmic protein LptC [Leptospira perolatii]PJZ72043.1 LPS export ABC transporter periplasmic protein LptC [Leptospira perolatii]
MISFGNLYQRLRKFLQSLDRETIQKYRLILAAVVGVSLLILFFTLASKKEAKYTRVESERETGSTISFRNFKRDQYDEQGKLLWKLKAKESFVFVGEGRTVFYDIDFEQFEDGKFKSALVGDKGEINHKTKMMLLNGNILLKTDGNRILRAKSLEYNTETKKVSSDEEVIIEADGTTIRGVGLRADKDLNKYTILRPTAVTHGGSNPLSPKKNR